MAELHDIIESDEMRDVIRAIEALKLKFATPASSSERPWPVALSLVGRYKADEVLRLLLDEKKYYPGYKLVITAAFGGWLLAPRAELLRKILMIESALAHMERAEWTASASGEFSLGRDVAARYVLTGTEFLTEVYDCLGGYQAFFDKPSLDELSDIIDLVEKPIRTAARALAYLHHAIDRFGKAGVRFHPSLSKAVLVLDELKSPKRSYPYTDHYVSRSRLHERWSQNKPTLALLYAASSLPFGRRPLLEHILDGELDYERVEKLLPKWVGRARYVSEHIFSRMDDGDLQAQTSRLLGEGDAIKFSPPKLHPAETASFEYTFRNYFNQIK